MDSSVTIAMDYENDLTVWVNDHYTAVVAMHYANESQCENLRKVFPYDSLYMRPAPLHHISGETRMRAKLITYPDGPADPSWAPTKVQWFDSPEALLLWIELSVTGRGL